MSRRNFKRTAPPRYPEHPEDEHELRINKLRSAMREDGVDVLLLARNANVFYVTGTRFVFVRTDAPRGGVPQTTAILTLDDLIYCQRFGPFDTDEVSLDTTWADTFELYDDEIELLSILRDHGVKRPQTIGTEWGPELCVGINPIKFQRLATQLEQDLGTSIIDATKTIKKAMAIKSPLEIKRMKKAVAAASIAAERIFNFVEVGMNVLDVSRQAQLFMLEAGADTVTHSQVMIEDEHPRLGSCDPVDRSIGVGYFHMDLGCTYRRYGSDIHRGIFLGREPTASERRLYECRVGVSGIFDNLIQDGVSVDVVLEEVDAYVRDCGCEISRKGTGVVAGHSIGLESYQGPALASSILQPAFQNEHGIFLFREGMMFAYEVPIRLPGSCAFFNIEDDVVITAKGIANMSSASPRELRVKL